MSKQLKISDDLSLPIEVAGEAIGLLAVEPEETRAAAIQYIAERGLL